jgi:hypothetical protein
MGQAFLDVLPPQPLKVLYVDFESNDEVFAEHLSTIGTAEGLDFIRSGLNFKAGVAFLNGLISTVNARKYDLVVVDPLIEAYPVKDENDNPEASRQMLAFRALAQATNAGVIVVHNAGGKKRGGKFLARGASARVDRADLVMNYTIKGAQKDGQRMLEVVKTRTSNLGHSLQLRFSENFSYEVQQSNLPAKNGSMKWQNIVLNLMETERAQGRLTVSRKALLDRFRMEDAAANIGTLDQALNRALGVLFKESRVIKVTKGVYALHGVEVISDAN